jgi:hypothetical protein
MDRKLFAGGEMPRPGQSAGTQGDKVWGLGYLTLGAVQLSLGKTDPSYLASVERMAALSLGRRYIGAEDDEEEDEEDEEDEEEECLRLPADWREELATSIEDSSDETALHDQLWNTPRGV